jgi:hypothetical protein
VKPAFKKKNKLGLVVEICKKRYDWIIGVNSEFLFVI